MILDVPVIINGEEKVQHEIVYDIDNFPYSKYRFADTVRRRKIQYYNISAAFDIESTTIDGEKNKANKYIISPYGFMYHWQFCIVDTVVFGSTWNEFLILLKRLQVGLELTQFKKLVIYVHNLSYEFQFMKDFLEIISLFAKDKRKVMKFDTECFEFRCSYFLSNMSLAKFCENSKLCIHYKLVDTYDYKKLRTPSTPHTMTELAYDYNDVRGLCECIDTLLEEDTITSLPLTNTGYVRRDFRVAMNSNKQNRYNLLDTRLYPQEYQLLREAFRGGNTHANRQHANKVLDNVGSYDLQSSYPAVMAIDDFPIGKFIFVTLDTNEKIDFYLHNFCCVMEVEFFDIVLKDGIAIPYIPIAKCKQFGEYKNDNGRILESTYIRMTITNIDYDIICETYDFSICNFNTAMYARKGKLPIEFIETLMLFYKGKTELKGISDKEYEYMKSKNKVNSAFGMTVTAPDHSELEYNSDTHEWIENKPNIEESLDSFYKSRNNFLPYQWGVFVTANARKRLQEMLNVVGMDTVYTDTDSIKFVHPKKNIPLFEKINKRLIKEALHAQIPAYAIDSKGVKRYMGIWDYEGCYKQFKTLGAKKYCYVDNDGKFHTTVSGMDKKKGAKVIGNIHNFNIGKTFSDVGRTTSWYNEEPVHYIDINGEKILTASNIGILESTYTLGITDEYWECLLPYFEDIENIF